MLCLCFRWSVCMMPDRNIAAMETWNTTNNPHPVYKSQTRGCTKTEGVFTWRTFPNMAFISASRLNIVCSFTTIKCAGWQRGERRRRAAGSRTLPWTPRIFCKCCCNGFHSSDAKNALETDCNFQKMCEHIWHSTAIPGSGFLSLGERGLKTQRPRGTTHRLTLGCKWRNLLRHFVIMYGRILQCY